MPLHLEIFNSKPNANGRIVLVLSVDFSCFGFKLTQLQFCSIALFTIPFFFHFDATKWVREKSVCVFFKSISIWAIVKALWRQRRLLFSIFQSKNCPTIFDLVRLIRIRRKMWCAIDHGESQRFFVGVGSVFKREKKSEIDLTAWYNHPQLCSFGSACTVCAQYSVWMRCVTLHEATIHICLLVDSI